MSSTKIDFTPGCKNCGTNQTDMKIELLDPDATQEELVAKVNELIQNHNKTLDRLGSGY